MSTDPLRRFLDNAMRRSAARFGLTFEIMQYNGRQVRVLAINEHASPSEVLRLLFAQACWQMARALLWGFIGGALSIFFCR